PRPAEHVGGACRLLAPAPWNQVPEACAVEVSLHGEAIAAVARHRLVALTLSGPAKRNRADIYFIAEIPSRFDVIAVQEVQNNLSALREVMACLGRLGLSSHGRDGG